METQCNTVGNFHLSQVTTAFNSRSDNVFSCLDSLEAKHNAFEKNRHDNRSDFLKPDPAEEPICHKSNFKIPSAMPKRSRLPDYKLRPEKWKLYNLSDVSDNQLSNKSNRKTALAFFNSLKERNKVVTKTDEEEEDMTICTEADISRPSFASDKQHIFRKPTSRKKETKQDKDQKDGSSNTPEANTKALMVQTSEDKEVEGMGEDETSSARNFSEESKPDDVQFHVRIRKSKNKNIRPKTEDEEQELDSQNLTSTRISDKCESDENDDFCEDYTGESDEETMAIDLVEDRLEWSILNAKQLQEMKAEEQDSSDDEDVCRRAAEFAFVEAINSNSFLLMEGSDSVRGCENGDTDSVDDLDGVD